ncbi:MAG: hypothetical protein HRU36_04965 [Rickettsiales bacterium]|nr:hypothetical protein [Rickettsiales bacterium]
MLRYIILVFVMLCSGLCFAKSEEKQVVVILPMQHQALDDIVAGFKEGLPKFYKSSVHIKIHNAQGDYNLQNSMVQQAKQRRDVDLVVAIATTTLQNAAAVIDNKPVLGIAAMYTEEERLSRKNKNVTALQDEIEANYSLSFIKRLFPNIKKISIIHSNIPKIQKEVAEFGKLCNKSNIKVQRLLVPTLMDLYSVSKSIDRDSDIIFILKDNIIASGIQTLNKQASKLNIPIVTSDEGTVKQGSDVSLGVVEKNIGIEGARIATKILEGHDIGNMPIQYMKELTVFYNSKSSLDIKLVSKTAKELGYGLFIIEG